MIKVILKEKVIKLGEVGDLVTVKPGYARNYLFPQNKALRATKENIEVVEEKKAELLKLQAERLVVLTERADKVRGYRLILKSLAKEEEDVLFGSISARDIAAALTAQEFDINANEVLMPEGAIKQLGEHEINLQFSADVKATITLEIQREEDEN
jgi:large subunit ribosomal protein L9